VRGYSGKLEVWVGRIRLVDRVDARDRRDHGAVTEGLNHEGQRDSCGRNPQPRRFDGGIHAGIGLVHQDKCKSSNGQWPKNGVAIPETKKAPQVETCGALRVAFG